MDGIDILFFGPDDFKINLGLPMDLPLQSTELSPYVGQLIAACRKISKPVMTPATTPEALRFALDKGFSFIVVGADVSFIKGGSSAALEMVKQVREKMVGIRLI